MLDFTATSRVDGGAEQVGDIGDRGADGQGLPVDDGEWRCVVGATEEEVVGPEVGVDEPFGRDLAVEPERGELDETVQDRDGVVVEATVEAIETHRKEHLEDSCYCRPAFVATTEIL